MENPRENRSRVSPIGWFLEFILFTPIKKQIILQGAGDSFLLHVCLETTGFHLSLPLYLVHLSSESQTSTQLR